MSTYGNGIKITTSHYTHRGAGLTGTVSLFQADASPSATYVKGFCGPTDSKNIWLCFGPVSASATTDGTIQHRLEDRTVHIPDVASGSPFIVGMPAESLVAGSGTVNYTGFGYDSQYGLFVPPGFYVFLFGSNGGTNLLKYEITQTILSQA